MIRICSTGRTYFTFPTRFHNRNPRNLDKKRISDVPVGWEFQRTKPRFIYKCELLKTDHHTISTLYHYSQGEIFRVSTQEPFIHNSLYSTTDISASVNVAKIMAVRMKYSGINSVFIDNSLADQIKSLNVFIQTLEHAGIKTSEDFPNLPEYIGLDYDSMNEADKEIISESYLDKLKTSYDWSNVKYPYSLRPKKDSSKSMSLSKMREGMVWNEFYHSLMKPENFPAWQNEKDEIESSKEVKVAIPKKWDFEK